MVGVQIQRRQAGGPWEPLPQAGNDLGVILNPRQGERIKIDDVNEWQSYEFRARLVAVATGPTVPGAPSLGNEVLVFAGDSPLSSDIKVWEEQDSLSWEGVPLSIATADRGDPAFFTALRQISANWLPIVGPPPRARPILANGLMRFPNRLAQPPALPLLRVSPPVQQGQQPRVRFGLTRHRDGAWLSLVEENVELGAAIGDPEGTIRCETLIEDKQRKYEKIFQRRLSWSM